MKGQETHMDLGLAGKTAIVTGASRGVGRSIVERLLAERMRVAFCARNPGFRFAIEIRGAEVDLPVGGAGQLVHHLDRTDP